MTKSKSEIHKGQVDIVMTTNKGDEAGAQIEMDVVEDQQKKDAIKFCKTGRLTEYFFQTGYRQYFFICVCSLN